MSKIVQNITDAAKKGFEVTTSESSRQKVGKYIDSQIQKTKDLLNEDCVKKTQFLVDPSRCKMWAQHNRRYQLLSEINCADLIEGFMAVGKQQFPAVVRRISDDSGYDFEVISGARRHWTTTYLGWKYYVEVYDLDDEEAFRISDIENRSREDISDYERATDYKNALSRYYNSQKQMAIKLDVSVGWLSRFLALADLPIEIVEAYSDITEIKVQHYRDLSKGLKNAKNKERMINRAMELKDSKLEGRKLVLELKKVISTNARKSQYEKHYNNEQGEQIFTVTKKPGGHLVCQFDPKSGHNQLEIMRLFEQILLEHQ